jgi:carbamoyltransferase
MYILGLNAYHGDASACIYKDGVLIAASEEERFRRIKHWAGLPSEAIKFCLAEAGIPISKIDYITISRDPKANFSKKIVHSLKNLINIKTIKDRLSNSIRIGSVKSEIAKSLGIDESEIKAEVVNVEHHRSHMASAFFASSFYDSAILSVDGFGDFTSTMIGVGRGNYIEVLDEVNYPHSLGIFYTTFTQYLGFPHYGDEYKVMGLAPYGEAKYVEQLKDVIIFKSNGLFELNLKYFRHAKEGVKMSWDKGNPDIGMLYSNYLVKKFGPARKKEEELTQYHRDIAASVQRICEETIFHILTHLHEKTGISNLSLAGGVAQNSVANGKLLSNTPFKKIYIPPAGHDAGTSLGSALWLYNQVLQNDRLKPMQHGYFGSKFSNEEIKSVLDKENVSYSVFDDEKLYEIVTKCIIDGGVVGWFQGRAEFGPRALGHRSIIADPRRTDAKEILNSKIKRRESFRPFAPSILKEFVSEYFEITDDVPFMEKVYQIKKEKHAVIPAVTHVDGTGRLQTVEENIEPKYYRLIKKFYDKTGVPVLLNTSFNENEPIVNTPQEALACYLRTSMDMLVMENCVVSRVLIS